MRDVRFANIVGEAEGGIVIYGDTGSWVQDVHLDHIALKIHAPRKQAAELAGGNFDFRWTATSLAGAVFKHDIPGLYCRYIEGLRIHDVTLGWGEELPDYFSNGIECEDFRHLDLDHFEGWQASPASPAPAILLRRGKDVSVRNSKADAGTATFLSASEVSEEGSSRAMICGVRNASSTGGNTISRCRVTIFPPRRVGPGGPAGNSADSYTYRCRQDEANEIPLYGNF